MFVENEKMDTRYFVFIRIIKHMHKLHQWVRQHVTSLIQQNYKKWMTLTITYLGDFSANIPKLLDKSRSYESLTDVPITFDTPSQQAIMTYIIWMYSGKTTNNTIDNIYNTPISQDLNLRSALHFQSQNVNAIWVMSCVAIV